jgi:hypothetical protein
VARVLRAAPVGREVVHVLARQALVTTV